MLIKYMIKIKHPRSVIRTHSINCNFSINMESKIQVGNYKINYLVSGIGEHAVLCLPGAVGSIWTDFGKQIVGFDQNKYKLIVWDPPGYGNSRPPKKNFTQNYLSEDADAAADLMKRLNINNYSILGWSDGGITGLFMASRYSNVVNKLVTWGANAYITEEDIIIYTSIKDTGNWSTSMREPLEKIYGAEVLKSMMIEWCDTMMSIFTELNGDICRKEVKNINVPTFILHGAKDPIIPRFHPDFLHKHIKNSRLHIFENGKHNIHIRYAEEFNELVQNFLEN